MPMRRRSILRTPLCLLPIAAPVARADEALLKRVASLAPNHGLRLGTARLVGEFNEVSRRFDLHRTGPRSRDFCKKMVWAPERRRALFVGANHGSPHRLNDVWEFDLATMTWLMLYAPDNPRTYAGLGPDASDVVFRDGVLQTRRGGPAVIGHTWSGLTYDPRARHMLFMNTWPIDVDRLVRQVGGDPADRYLGPPLWAFDPAARAWRPIKTAAPWPKAALGALLQDVPELGGPIWHLNNWQLQATWLLGPDAAWKMLAGPKITPGFEQNAPGRELVGYHDAKRHLIIAQYRNGTYHFDTRSRQWACTIRPDTSPAVPDGYDASTVIYGDATTDRGLLIDFRTRVLWAYDPDRSRWEQMYPSGDAMPAGKRMLAYLDHALGVLVVLNDTEVWVYRPAPAR
jgi:hypothetical protein